MPCCSATSSSNFLCSFCLNGSTIGKLIGLDRVPLGTLRAPSRPRTTSARWGHATDQPHLPKKAALRGWMGQPHLRRIRPFPWVLRLELLIARHFVKIGPRIHLFDGSILDVCLTTFHKLLYSNIFFPNSFVIPTSLGFGSWHFGSWSSSNLRGPQPYNHI